MLLLVKEYQLTIDVYQHKDTNEAIIAFAVSIEPAAGAPAQFLYVYITKAVLAL